MFRVIAGTSVESELKALRRKRVESFPMTHTPDLRLVLGDPRLTSAGPIELPQIVSPRVVRGEESLARGYVLIDGVAWAEQCG